MLTCSITDADVCHYQDQWRILGKHAEFVLGCRHKESRRETLMTKAKSYSSSLQCIYSKMTLAAFPEWALLSLEPQTMEYNIIDFITIRLHKWILLPFCSLILKLHLGAKRACIVGNDWHQYYCNVIGWYVAIIKGGGQKGVFLYSLLVWEEMPQQQTSSMHASLFILTHKYYTSVLKFIYCYCQSVHKWCRFFFL